MTSNISQLSSTPCQEHPFHISNNQCACNQDEPINHLICLQTLQNRLDYCLAKLTEHMMKPEAIKMEGVPSQKRESVLPLSCATSEPDSCRPLSQILVHSRYISDLQNVRNVRLTAARRRASPRWLSSVTVACNQPASRHGDGLIGGADEV